MLIFEENPLDLSMGECQRFVMAPEGMGAEDAKLIIDVEIQRANLEDERNIDIEGPTSGCCDDGLPVEESIKANLTKQGFEFFKPTLTQCWDEVQR